MATELDFDRSLPPIMPRHGDWFNQRVCELVDASNGQDDLSSSLVDTSEPARIAASLGGIDVIVYPEVRHG